jgi:hypothetical protein
MFLILGTIAVFLYANIEPYTNHQFIDHEIALHCQFSFYFIADDIDVFLLGREAKEMGEALSSGGALSSSQKGGNAFDGDGWWYCRPCIAIK